MEQYLNSSCSISCLTHNVVAMEILTYELQLQVLQHWDKNKNKIYISIQSLHVEK